MPTQKIQREERAQPNFGSSFYVFSPPPGSALCKLAWPGVLFVLSSSLQSSDLPLIYFLELFPSLSFSDQHFGLLFPILTI